MALGLGLALLAGCGGGDEQGADDPVELSFWAWAPNIDKVVDKWNTWPASTPPRPCPRTWSARTDGPSEVRILGSIALPMMVPGLVTVFLFVSIRNNFMLPFIMLGDDEKFPVTLGLYTLLNQGNTTPALYTLVVTGSLVSVLPLIALFLTLQRYWRIDLLSGAVKA